jgi:hypothetical protein
MQVQVKNLDTREYVEMFRDQEIRIPAGESVSMGRSEAIAFLGQFIPMIKDGAERHIKPKKLEIIEDPEQHAAARGQPEKFESVDGKMFRTQAGLEQHNRELKAESESNTEGTSNGSTAPKRRTRVATARR